MIVISPNISIPDDEYWFTYARSGGPGGQNVNKVNSKATLHWNVIESRALPEGVRQRFLRQYKNRVTAGGVVLLTSQRYRDQPKNSGDCIEKLTAMVREVLHPAKPRRATKPTHASRRRRLEGKRLRSAKKETRKSPGGEW